MKPTSSKTPAIAVLTLSATLLAAMAVAMPTSAKTSPTNDECTTLSPGLIACGSATASICSGGASGASTGLVHWKLVIRTRNVYSENTLEYPVDSAAFAGAQLARICTTGTCTWAYLYANNQLVAESLGVC